MTESIWEEIKGVVRPVREFAVRIGTRRRGVPRTVNGTTYRVDARCRQTFTPTYDEGASALIRGILRPGGEAWNVGANVGVHALQLCSIVGPAGRVVAFEPNPRSAALLRRNAMLNGYQDRLEILGAAIGDRAGDTVLHVSGHDGMSRPGKPNPRLRRTAEVVVPTTTLDDFWDGRARAPDCVVMDIEGWEVAALSRADRVLSAARSSLLLVVELHPDAWSWSGHSRAQLERLLESYGLEALSLSGQPDPFDALGQVVFRPRAHA